MLTFRVQVEYRHGMIVVHEPDVGGEVPVRVDGFGVSEQVVRHRCISSRSSAQLLMLLDYSFV